MGQGANFCKGGGGGGGGTRSTKSLHIFSPVVFFCRPYFFSF